MPRTLFVGDVHGCSDELRKLLALARLGPADEVVFVGDLVARGPDSRGVLRLFRELGARSVLGNHERRLLEVREARSRGESGPHISRAAEQLYASLDAEDWASLASETPTLELPEHDVRVVHGGVVPGRAVEAHDLDTLTRMRSLGADGEPSDSFDVVPWAASYLSPPHVVFGHNALAGLQLYPYATGLDTGCVYGGSLTGLLLGEGEQVPQAFDQRRTRLLSVPAARRYFAPHGPQLEPG